VAQKYLLGFSLTENQITHTSIKRAEAFIVFEPAVSYRLTNGDRTSRVWLSALNLHTQLLKPSEHHQN